MNIVCNRAALLEAVGNVQRAVSGKSTLPALEGILLKAADPPFFWRATIWIWVSPPPSRRR